MKQANPYSLRIDSELMEAIKQSAINNGRSVNKEIEFAIKQFLKNQ